MAAVLAALLASVNAAPTKVFILIGQSNMEGHGLVSGGNGTLEYAVKHHPSAAFPICNITEAAERREGCVAAGANLDGLKRADGSWNVWNNINVDYFGKVGPKWGPVKSGPLTVGFGFDDKHMGPELGFGVEMSKH